MRFGRYNVFTCKNVFFLTKILSLTFQLMCLNLLLWTGWWHIFSNISYVYSFHNNNNGDVIRAIVYITNKNWKNSVYSNVIQKKQFSYSKDIPYLCIIMCSFCKNFRLNFFSVHLKFLFKRDGFLHIFYLRYFLQE